jgi:hypothetical protein
MRPPTKEGLAGGVLETTADLFQASVALRAGGAVQRWNISQDALVWPTAGGR